MLEELCMAMDCSNANFPLHNKLKPPPTKPKQASKGWRGGLAVKSSSARGEDQIQSPSLILAGTTCNLQVSSEPLRVATLSCT